MTALSSSFTRDQRSTLTRRRVARPVVLFCALAVAYPGAVTLALAMPAPLSYALSLPCGVLIGMLFIVGHDAGHNSFTASTRLNRVIGRLAFLPALHSFSLWDLAHNRTHHRYNNIHGLDYAWVPMSPEEYRRSSRPRRFAYRLFRAPIGVTLYYLLVLWPPRQVLPLPRFVGRITPVHLADTLLVLTFLVLQLRLVAEIGDGFGKSTLDSLLVGAALPFLAWCMIMSLAIFLHHTHPAVRWYASVTEWTADRGVIRGAVHVRFPWPFEPMLLAIMEHNAHHLAPGVPLYNLSRMQLALEERMNCLSWRFSWRGYVRICRMCKLYDYQAQCWVGFADCGETARCPRTIQ